MQSLVTAVKKIAESPDAKDKNRVGVLLVTGQTTEMKTKTHVMWVLFSLLRLLFCCAVIGDSSEEDCRVT